MELDGVSQGIASPLTTALWAEVYGVESLGAIKGSVATFGIFATALGPVLLGWLLKMGVSFTLILWSCALLGVATLLFSLIARRILRRMEPVQPLAQGN